MPRRYKQNYDFDIHVDPSCLSEPMDEETLSQSGGIEKKDETIETQDDTSVHCEQKEDLEETVEASTLDQETSTVEEPTADESLGEHLEDVLPSIETEQAELATDQHDLRSASSASRRSSSKRTEEIIQAAARDIIAHIEQHNKAKQEGSAEPSEFDHLETKSHTSRAARTAAGDDSNSSQHEATDEDVFSDKSPRSSLGSYDFGSESGKGHEFPDNLTSVSRSPRISDLPQYDDNNKDEDFIPTIRGTPRPAFRTPSDVRAMQMSSPTQSVVGGTSPRSSRRYMPTVSRLGTPTASAQYSPKKTPDRLKPRKEAPLVLLHVTLLPLRWAWGELIGSLEPADMSREAKALRDAWRLLQDRLGDTTCERGILLGHPQNDYEVLEERLLDALELPVRRRARILECGHYLGPANEMADDDEGESDREEYDDDVRSHRSSRRGGGGGADKRHWCGTCQGDIHYETLGVRTKVFRVKVYASNGLMKAGAWAACWKEMERVDVEIEPIVEPAVQDELVRLAATQQEREREEDEIAHEVAQQFEAEKKKEEEAEEERGRSRGSRHSRSEMHARVDDVEDDDDDDDDDDIEGDTIPPTEEDPEPVPSFEASGSEEERRRRLDEERMREIYGDSSSPAAEGHHGGHASAASPDPHPSDSGAQQPHSDSYAPSPDPYSASEGTYHGQENKRQKLDGASLPELLLESARVLLQDRKNLAIIALSVFVVLLAVRVARREPPYEPGLHGIMANVPELRHVPVVEAPHGPIQDDVPVAEVVPRALVDESETEEVPELQQVLETQETSEAEQAPELQLCSEGQSSTEVHDITTDDLAPEDQVPAIDTVEDCTKQFSVEQPPVDESTESSVDADEVSTAAACSTAAKVESLVPEQTPEDATAEMERASNDYDECVRLSSIREKGASSVSEEIESEDVEVETVMRKRTVKIVQTVTETETQTQFKYITATEFLLQSEPTSSVNDAPDAVLCDTVNWEAVIEDIEGKGEPMVEAAAETEVEEENREAGAVRGCPEVEEAT